MIRSKDVAHYFLAQLDDLIPGKPLTFDVLLYFKRNNHILMWFANKDAPSQAIIDKYKGRGVRAIWIHSDDKEAFEIYKRDVQTLAPAPQQAAPAPSTPQKVEAIELAMAADLVEGGAQDVGVSGQGGAGPGTPDAEFAAPGAAVNTPTPVLAPKSESAQKIIAQMQSAEPNPTKKAALVAIEARKALNEALVNEEVKKQDSLNAEARKIAKDILDEIQSESRALISEVWSLAEADADLTHGVNVATYGVMMALAFGKIEKGVLSEIALAGILHDTGVSRISPLVAQKPVSTRSSEDHKAYEGHVEAGIEISRAHESKLTDRVATMITQHHEKFNGQGYPHKLEGFKLDAIGQIVAIAEMLDTMASGQWDGVRRSYKQVLVELEQIEKSRTFPEYFNPEIFGKVIRWAQTKEAKAIADQAMKIVRDQSETSIQGKVA